MSTSPLQARVEAPARMLPASRFTIEQLTTAYNQTRVDYLVPMPMNTARLSEYIHMYDVDLDASVVALDGDTETMLGLAMLGVRAGRAWITRLGVLPAARRRHIGRALVEALLAASERLSLSRVALEVIKNNVPAYNLFVQCGFQPVQDFLVLRRPPGPPAAPPLGEATWLEEADAWNLLRERGDKQTWITESESLARASHLQAVMVTLPDGGSGWLVFQEQRFRGLAMLLSRFCLHTRAGHPLEVGRTLLAHLYTRFSELDTHVENVAEDDPHLPAMLGMGFLETFRRIEMHRALQSAFSYDHRAAY